MTTPVSQDLFAWWSFDEGRGRFTRDEVAGRMDPIEYAVGNNASQHPSEPRWVDGVSGTALLFDGYSTWIERSAEAIRVPQQALTITAWVAPRSFEKGDEKRLSAIVNQHHREKRQGYILGLYRHGAWSFQVGAGGEWYELWADAHLISCDAWSHLSAVFDGSKGSMALFLNGEEVERKQILPGIMIRPARMSLLIGKNNQAAPLHKHIDEAAGGKRCFVTNMLNGVLDNLRLYARALSSDEIKRQYRDCLAAWAGSLPKPATALSRIKYKGDRDRPQYHFIPPEHWQNEQHGPLHFNGQYHLFYQLNPQGPYWSNIHWGHAVSDDLAHWRDLPFALAPERHAVDPDGCWSGCTIVDDDGAPRIFYTAGDESHDPNQSVAMAVSTFLEDGDNDLKRWVKYPRLIVEQQKGIGRYGEFRDPYVFKDHGVWYMLVGSGIPDRGGAALLYASIDLLNWTYQKPFFIGDLERYPRTGEVWELPGLLPLGRDHAGQEKYLFVINPWFKQPNPNYCKYVFHWIGSFDREHLQFIPDRNEPDVINVGEHWIGPSYLVDQQGRCIIFGLVHHAGLPMHRVYERGWHHHTALPVCVSLRPDGRLGVEPVPELRSLRKAEVLSIEQTDLDAANAALQQVNGDQLEVWIEFTPQSSSAYGLDVYTDPEGEEVTRIFYRSRERLFGMDTRRSRSRTRSGVDASMPRGIESGTLDLQNEGLRLHVFVDKSVVEAFANGLKSVTTIVYPTRSDAWRLGMRIWAEGVQQESVAIKAIKVWELGSAYSGEAA